MAVTQNKHGHFLFEEIDSKFMYIEETGDLYRLEKIKTYKEEKDTGRLLATQVKFQGYSIMVTHIMFMLKMKRGPKFGMIVDHKDCDAGNTSWDNLREATGSQNNYNRAPPGRWNHEDGLELGVQYKGPGKYKLFLTEDGVQRYYGLFSTKEEANAVSRSEVARIQGEFKYGYQGPYAKPDGGTDSHNESSEE